MSSDAGTCMRLTLWWRQAHAAVSMSCSYCYVNTVMMVSTLTFSHCNDFKTNAPRTRSRGQRSFFRCSMWQNSSCRRKLAEDDYNVCEDWQPDVRRSAEGAKATTARPPARIHDPTMLQLRQRIAFFRGDSQERSQMSGMIQTLRQRHHYYTMTSESYQPGLEYFVQWAWTRCICEPNVLASKKKRYTGMPNCSGHASFVCTSRRMVSA